MVSSLPGSQGELLESFHSFTMTAIDPLSCSQFAFYDENEIIIDMENQMVCN